MCLLIRFYPGRVRLGNHSSCVLTVSELRLMDHETYLDLSDHTNVLLCLHILFVNLICLKKKKKNETNRDVSVIKDF